MEKIKGYSQFNEEISLRKAVVGGALAASLAAGGGCGLDRPEVRSVETVDRKGHDYQSFVLTTKDLEEIEVFVSKNGVITSSWREKVGKSRRTYRTISVPKGTRRVYYDTRLFGGYYADTDPISEDWFDVGRLEVLGRQGGITIRSNRSFFEDTQVAEYDAYRDDACKFTAGGREYTYVVDDGAGILDRRRYYVVPSSRTDW